MKHLAILITLTIFSAYSNAGIYTDDLSRCLVEKTNAKDKNIFVKWMFTALSHHPLVEKDVSLSAESIESANKNMANLMAEMLTVRCLEVAKKAVSYEGPASIQAAFTVFGQVAGQELMGNPKVAQSLSSFDKHLDSEALNSKLGIK